MIAGKFKRMTIAMAVVAGLSSALLVQTPSPASAAGCPPRIEAVGNFVFIFGHTIGETAAAYGISTATVRAYVARYIQCHKG
jgi:hypothetical protein